MGSETPAMEQGAPLGPLADHRFRELVEGLVAIVWEADAETLTPSFVSREAELLLGYPVEEWLGDPGIWGRIVHPDDLDRVMAACTSATGEGRDHEVEYRAVAADGRVLWLRDIVRVVTDEDGRPSRVCGIILDVTERRRAEEALQESESRYRTLFEEARDAVYVTTRDGEFIDVNQAALDLLGYTRDEIIGLNAASFYFDEQDRLEFQREIEGKGSVRNFEVRLQSRDGLVLDCLLTSGARRASDGTVVGYHGIIHDITGRKQTEDALRYSEQHFRSLIENALDTITVIDREGTILYESPSVERVLGYTPEELFGKSVFSLVHPGEVPRALETLGHLFEQPGTARTVEVRFQHKDGSWRNLEATGRNLLEDPTVAGIVINARDITERRRLEEQLQQAQKMEAIGRLAGGVAHDFNNLLTAIRGHAQLLLDDLTQSDPMRAELEEIGKAAVRATSLTRQLLAFSRKQVLQPRVVDLNGIIAEMQSMLSRLIGVDVVLECVLAHDLGRVKADPSQIEQVLLNLALNARDAMPVGGRLTIQTTNVVLEREAARQLTYSIDPGAYVLLSIHDTGSGMDAETQAHIFEPFFTTKEQGKGTGLGLSTVYGIIKQSGGYIGVESHPASGTTFEIYLPRVDGEAEPGPVVLPEGAPRGSETILLVEDEDTVRSLADRVLQRSGYDVLHASNGCDALDVCERHPGPIHMVLTDVVMPTMNGRTLVQQLLSMRPALRVIFMSGYSEDAIAQEGAIQHGSAFLPKPFTPDRLARVVREVLDRPLDG